MILSEHQRLPTTGARAVLSYVISGARYLIVPQLSKDVENTPAHMNGGDSDTGAPIFKWSAGRFVQHDELPLTGGEDIDYFQLGADQFLITAGVRSGHGPYDYNIDQTLFKWSGSCWEPHQTFPGFAAKQWHFFKIGDRAFLCLAQGVTLGHIEAKNPRTSRIFEWNGTKFVDFQSLEGQWGYNWESFQIDGQTFLGYADHVGDSLIFKWDGSAFVPFQSFAPKAGRCFRFFTVDEKHYLAFANIQGDSTLYRWDGQKFQSHQKLSGPSGRELRIVRTEKQFYLVQINFIEGEPSAPKTDLKSRIYRWEKDQFLLVEEFATAGATDAAAFRADGRLYLAVSNSLTPEVRFRTDTIIYSFNG
jgi:EPTP domain